MLAEASGRLYILTPASQKMTASPIAKGTFLIPPGDSREATFETRREEEGRFLSYDYRADLHPQRYDDACSKDK